MASCLLCGGALLYAVAASVDTCEKRDGNCPQCKLAGYNGTLNFNAVFTISPNQGLGDRAAAAHAYIASQGAVRRFDDPYTQLHTTVFYFCCHTDESARGVLDAMHKIEWAAFDIHYDTFGCNLGMHAANKKTLYLHAMPSDQDPLFALARKIESAAVDAGWWINHPRQSLFHMTHARVGYDYPVDDVVTAFVKNGTDFGTVRFAKFTANVPARPSWPEEVYEANGRGDEGRSERDSVGVKDTPRGPRFSRSTEHTS